MITIFSILHEYVNLQVVENKWALKLVNFQNHI